MSDQKPVECVSPAIEMSGVACGSLIDPDARVLEDINWRVLPGEYWVVAGLHGSGKSDFVALTAGLTRPLAGIYRLFGHDMPIFEEELVAERLRIGVVFEASHLLHRLTVAENVVLPLRYHRNFDETKNAERLEAMLKKMELTPWAAVTPGRLGWTWQKRVMLARALMLEPEVLVLDNPLAGLDSRHIHWWLNFLGQLSSGGDFTGGRKMTLVATAEDLRPWKAQAHQFAILQHGRFLTLGERSMLAGHGEPLVKELLADGFAEG